VERRACMEAADDLPILRHGDGALVLQCEEFESFAEPQFETRWMDRTVPFASQVAQELLYRCKCLKQADVLMMMALFPDEFSDDEVRRAWDYYTPYTTHDSSLSAGIHAIVACRLGLCDEAWHFWQAAKSIDLDVAHGGAAEGIHIAAAAANWMVVTMGFAGMRSAMQSEEMSLRPRLPHAWRRLAFPIVWKRTPLFVDIRAIRTAVTNRGSQSLAVLVDGESRQVDPGRTEEWETRA